MGVKKNNRFQLNWSATQNFPYNLNTPLSGVTSGVMSGTSVIYSNVQDVRNFDNLGLVVTFTGTPAGTIEIMGSNFPDLSEPFYAITFNPALAQPAGGGGGYIISLTGFPWYFLMVRYTNASGTGVLKISIAQKDVN